MFLNWIDYFTPRHLEMLKFFRDFKPRSLPTKTGEIETFFFTNGDTRKLGVEQAFPDVSLNDNIYNQILADLLTRGLINPNGSDLFYFKDKVKYNVEITKLGQDFLDFITSPIESIDENNME